MIFKYFNPNPQKKIVEDCAIRAIARVTDEDWETIYIELVLIGYSMYDVPSSTAVVNAFLRNAGFTRHAIPNTCPDCYTIEDFCIDHADGRYIVATQSHLTAVVDGETYDTWDCTEEIPIYYWRKE